MIKSVLQNIDNYADRAAARAQCDHEAAVLRDPEIRPRSRAMLEGRVAGGMEGMVQEYQLLARNLDLDLDALKMPIAVFHGIKDEINPIGGAQALVAHLPNAELRELPDMGHAFVSAEWGWLLRAAMGQAVQMPTGHRRGILTNA